MLSLCSSFIIIITFYLFHSILRSPFFPLLFFPRFLFSFLLNRHRASAASRAFKLTGDIEYYHHTKFRAFDRQDESFARILLNVGLETDSEWHPTKLRGGASLTYLPGQRKNEQLEKMQAKKTMSTKCRTRIAS